MKKKTEKKSERTLLAIDPSINYCGAAIFDVKTKHLLHAELVVPDKVLKRDGEFYDKAHSVFEKVSMLREKWGCIAIACELPDHWSVAGHMARESGSITKLSFVCGMFYQMRNSVQRFVFALPREWKGQLSKDVMKNRIESTYVGKEEWQFDKEDWKNLNHNVCDAIGIGHWSLYGRV